MSRSVAIIILLTFLSVSCMSSSLQSGAGATAVLPAESVASPTLTPRQKDLIFVEFFAIT
jgi:hypothetical protein